MSKYLFSALAAFAFILASCSESTEPTASPSIRPSVSDKAMETGSMDWEGDFYNECCDEWVSMSGTVRYAEKDGVAHFNPTGIVGISDDGTVYHGGGAQNGNFNYDEDGAGHDVYRFTIVMTAAGGCHFKIMYSVHHSWDANGNLRVDRITEVVDCNPDPE